MFKRIIAKIIDLYKTLIVRDKQIIAVKQWYKDNAEETLRLDYPLNENSLVFDIGGFNGGFAERMYEKYKCNILVFEPVLEYYKIIEEKFIDNPKIKVYNYGLSNKSKYIDFCVKGVGSSAYQIDNESHEKVKLYSITDFFKENSITKVDLMKINIEGGEFDLLPSMIENELLPMISDLQIQFHKFIKNSNLKRNDIVESLSKTHKLTFNYYFVWENWSKIEP